MLQVILDANSIVIPFQFRIDIFREIERLIPKKHEVVTLSCVLKELEGIRDIGKKGLELIKKKGVRIIRADGKADEELLRLGREGNSVVCTNDSNLRKRLREINVPIIYLRSRGHMELEGWLNESVEKPKAWKKSA